MYTFANTPEGIGRILDSGFRLCFAGYRTVLQLIGVMTLVYIVIFAGYWAIYGRDFLSMISSYQKGAIPSSGNGVYLGFLLLTFFVSIVYSNAITYIYGTLGHGQRVGMQQGLAVGARKFVPVIVYMFWYALILGIAVLPLIALLWAVHPGPMLSIVFIAIGIIPPVIFMISLIFGSYAVILDNTGIMAAIKLSHTLVWGKWWRTFIYAVIVSMIFMTLLVIIEVLIEIVSSLLIRANPENYPFITTLGMLINQVTSMIFMPFMTALIITYYHDLKLRKEGGDLAARIEAA